jgi:hypothetical protein
LHFLSPPAGKKRSGDSSGLLKFYFSLTRINDNAANRVLSCIARDSILGAYVMRALIAALITAMVFPLVGCASPMQQEGNVARASQHPYNLVVPSEILPAFL